MAVYVECLDFLDASTLDSTFGLSLTNAFNVDEWHADLGFVDPLLPDFDLEDIAGVVMSQVPNSDHILTALTAQRALAAMSAGLQAVRRSSATPEDADFRAKVRAELTSGVAFQTGLGNVTFGDDGVLRVLAAVSQYGADGASSLVFRGGAAPAPFLTYGEIRCVFTHNCTFAGACQPDGSCECRPTYKGTECQVTSCEPGRYLVTTEGAAPACSDCEPGTYRAMEDSSTACLTCDDDEYEETWGSEACSKCPHLSTRYPYTLEDLNALGDIVLDSSLILSLLATHASTRENCICRKGDCGGADCIQPDMYDGAETCNHPDHCDEVKMSTGAYSVDEPDFDGTMTCYRCPPDAYCRGAYDLPLPALGFAGPNPRRASRSALRHDWHQPMRYRECDMYEGECFENFNCPKNRMQGGLLCQTMRPGFTSLSDIEFECPGTSKQEHLLAQLFLTGGLIVLFFVVNHIADKYAAVGLFLTHARSLAIISSVNVPWPKDLLLSGLFAMLNITQFDIDVAPPLCFWNAWGFRERMGVQILLFFTMAGAYFSDTYLRAILKGEATDKVHDAWNAGIKMSIGALAMTYPSLAEATFAGPQTHSRGG